STDHAKRHRCDAHRGTLPATAMPRDRAARSSGVPASVAYRGTGARRERHRRTVATRRASPARRPKFSFADGLQPGASPRDDGRRALIVMLYNLHLLRVIAALGVVYFHITSVAGLKLDWDVGSRGVDVFFVISGFIIAYIGTSKPEQFFVRRLIRVVPFYWAATLVVFAMVMRFPELFHTTTANVRHLLAS